MLVYDAPSSNIVTACSRCMTVSELSIRIETTPQTLNRISQSKFWGAVQTISEGISLPTTYAERKGVGCTFQRIKNRLKTRHCAGAGHSESLKNQRIPSGFACASFRELPAAAPCGAELTASPNVHNNSRKIP